MAACGATPASSTGTSAPAGSSSAQGQATRTYFINPKMVGAAYWETAKEGAMQAGEDLGVEVIWNGTSEVDVAKQINMVTDMITRQVDGIAVAVNDATSMTNVFNQAKEASIPVVTFDSDSEKCRARILHSARHRRSHRRGLSCRAHQPDARAKAGKVAVMIASPVRPISLHGAMRRWPKLKKITPTLKLWAFTPRTTTSRKPMKTPKLHSGQPGPERHSVPGCRRDARRLQGCCRRLWRPASWKRAR